MSVLTSESLRRAGVRSVPDALRLAVGLAVGRDQFSWSITSRGFNSAAANKLVVLLDGRSLYTPLFSGVFWNIPDLILEDVDRIEIVRGAGGTLWGANAMNGVINIITKLAADTQGALIAGGLGMQDGVAAARYGGPVGDGAYRVYAKFRHLDGTPLLDGTDPDNSMAAAVAGARVDFGPDEATAVTVQGDIYRGRERLGGRNNAVRFNGGNLLARIRRTFTSGAQLQVQAYYDNTYRRVITQYGERRHTGDVELQYRFSAGARHALVAGGGLTLSHDRTTPTATFFFEPASRTLTLANVFLQDEIALVPGRVAAILGTRVEHNSYTGMEIQPTGRLRWTPGAGHTMWGGVSRAVRMPTRFDTDLRFTANQPFVVLRGGEDFQSETMIGAEVGYRTFAIPKVGLAIVGFINEYDDIRSQEPTPPLGVPIVLDNQHHGRISGLEISARYQPGTDWEVSGGYAHLRERFGFDAGSRDRTSGSLEHNDPSHQVWLRLGADLPGGLAFDAMLRRVSALPAPVVPAYTELNLHLARLLTSRLEISVAAENLLHDRHAEWFNLGPRHGVPRAVFLRLTWRSQ